MTVTSTRIIREPAVKIELDAVVNEYTLDALENSGRPPVDTERAVTKILSVLIQEGMIKHRYDARRKLDEFRATPRLVRLWRRDFPEVGDIANATDTIIVELGEAGKTFAMACLAESQ